MAQALVSVGSRVPTGLTPTTIGRVILTRLQLTTLGYYSADEFKTKRAFSKPRNVLVKVDLSDQGY